MSFYPELDGLSMQELVQYFTGAPLDGPEYTAAYYEEVAAQISQHKHDGIPWLFSALHNRSLDTDHVRAILLALAQSSIEDGARIVLQDALLAALDDPRPLVVAEAIDGLWRQDMKVARDRILSLENDPSPSVRASVLRFLSHVYPGAARRALRRGLLDASPLVRETAIDELDWLGDLKAMGSIAPLLQDVDPAVREAAATAVANVAV